MNKDCPRCDQSTEQDGLWPIDLDGDTVQGCYECFEQDAADMWWLYYNYPFVGELKA